MYDIWSVLEIEPTKDKSVIQKAYAEMLKIYHPEDDPEGFQQLQEAYRAAIAYAKNHSVPMSSSFVHTATTEPAVKLQNVEYKKKAERAEKAENVVQAEKAENVENAVQEKVVEQEQIPEYIAELAETDIQSMYEELIEKYVLFLAEKLVGYKRKKDLKEVERLFDSIQFRNVLNLDAFLVRFEKEMSYFESWNQKILRLLLKKIKEIMREDKTHNLGRLKSYLETKVIDNSEETKTILGFCAVIAFLCLILWFHFANSGEYILNNAPTSKEVCQQVWEKYGIEIDPVNIQKSYTDNLDAVTKQKNPKVVVYEIVYEDGDTSYSFSGTYLPKGQSEISFNLEKALIAQYMEKHLEYTFWPNWNCLGAEAIRIQADIEDEKDIDKFVNQFSTMINELFRDPRMANSDYTFLFDIGLQKITPSLYISMNKDDYLEKCDLISEKLEALLQE